MGVVLSIVSPFLMSCDHTEIVVINTTICVSCFVRRALMMLVTT